MKKIKLILLPIFAILFFLSANTTFAQQPPCPPLPDCPNDPWQTGFIDIQDPCVPTCTLRVFYCYRVACGQYADFHVSGIMYLNPSCGLGLTGGCPYDMIWNAALKAVINENKWNIVIPPCPAQSQIIWRLSVNQCWGSWQLPDGRRYDVPCNLQAQCWRQYRACFNGTTTELELISTGSGLPIDCDECTPLPPVTGATPLEPCNQICY